MGKYQGIGRLPFIMTGPLASHLYMQLLDFLRGSRGQRASRERDCITSVHVPKTPSC